MEFIADFHIHSKYSRATSRDMDIKHLAEWAKIKGITLLGSGDFTHHLWLEELKGCVEDLGNGLFKYNGIYFILTSEISSIYSKKGKTYRIHNMVISPSFKTTDKINHKLSQCGNLASDGRPILGLDAAELARIVFDIDENCMVIPAHCLLPDTLVHTANGLKSIKNISTKDRVYTHKLHFKKVSKLLNRKYKGQVYHVKPYYFREGIVATPEHPFYIMKTFKNCATRNTFCGPNCSAVRNKGCARAFFKRYLPEWTQAKDLRRGDIIIFPRFNEKTRDIKSFQIIKLIKSSLIISKENKIAQRGAKVTFINNKIIVGKNFCRLAGYFVSEGYTNSRDCISFCFLNKEREYIEDVIYLMRDLFGIKLSKHRRDKRSSGVELIFYSKVLCKLFSVLFYDDINDKKAHSKKLPDWMLDLPLGKQVEIIKGWWRGDKGYTVSRVLMNQMKIVFLRLGIIPSIGIDSIENYQGRGKHFIGCRQIFAKHGVFQFNNLSFFEDKFHLLQEGIFSKFKTKSLSRHGWLDNKYVYLPVREVIQKGYSGRVYNLEVEKDNSYVCEFATVHNCWTPWFSLFGSMSGFDKIQDCFEEQTPKIFALETGLSSDPAMNWRLSALDKFSLISNSDSHSPSKIGREANVFDCDLDYKTIREVLKTKDKKRFLYTIEFFPEEGKYHFDGHRNCGTRFSPSETRKNHNKCPKCGKPLTVGVMNRVEQLADRPEGFKPFGAIDFKNLVPLEEIIAQALGQNVGTQAVERDFRSAIAKFGTEFNILLRASEDDLLKGLPNRIAEGVLRMRKGKINILAGFDGEYGKISLFGEEDKPKEAEKQLSLF